MSTTLLTLPVILGRSQMLQRQRKSYKLCRITSSVDDDDMSVSATRLVSWSRCSNPTKKRRVFMAFFIGMKALFSWQNRMTFRSLVPDPSHHHVCAGEIPERGPQDMVVNLADSTVTLLSVSATIRINYESESIHLQLSLIGVQIIQVGRMLETILHLETMST